MELTHGQIEKLVYRFPKLELSYETFAHKKVSSNYDICISIPNGKKQFAWFTYCGEDNVCYLMDINKDQKVTKMVKVGTNIQRKLAYGTVFYGTLCSIDEKSVFIIEDVYVFCGLPTRQFTFGEKLTYFHTFMEQYSDVGFMFALPYMALVQGNNELLESLQFYESMVTKTAYATHHVQFRSSETICPYLNHTYKKKQEQAVIYEPDVILFPRTDLNYTTQSTLRNAVFRVTADIQNDVYHLFAYDGRTREYTYVNIAYIGSRTLSVYMNKLFRNIRENDNVDYGEESEDEDTFQNVNPDKYVDLKKEYKMNCVFHNKFKKWVPVSVVDGGSRCVNINDLISRAYVERPYSNNQAKPYSNNQARPYVERPYSNNQARPYVERPYSNNQARPYSNNQARPYVERPYSNNQARPYSNNQAKPYSNNQARPYGNNQAKPYVERPYGNKQNKYI